MTGARWTTKLTTAVLAGLLLEQVARAQETGKTGPQGNNAATAAKSKNSEAVKDAKKEPPPPKPRIAVFRLAGALKETPTDETFNFGGEPSVPLAEVAARMDKASKDSNVKAVVILLDQATIGSAQVEELRQAISRLRAADREVIAHADTIGGLGQYALIWPPLG
jgi:protease-4